MEDSTEEAKDEELIDYSEKYYDDTYEYRHVILPPKIAVEHPMVKLLEEDEWRAIGVCQSLGWVNYAIHRPEPHIMLFRRPRKNMNSGDPLDNQQQQQPQGLHDGQEKKPNRQG